MTTARITRFAPVAPRAHFEGELNTAAKLMKFDQVALGTVIGMDNTVEVISECQPDNAEDPIHELLGAPSKTIHVALNRSLFGSTGAATRPVIEYVQTYFPASRVTPNFQNQIEGDFARFNSLAFNGAKGGHGGDYAYGWVKEEHEHDEIEGEKTRSFFMARAWDSMELFEQFMQSDEAKANLPILLGWGAPFDMWHMKRNGTANTHFGI